MPEGTTLLELPFGDQAWDLRYVYYAGLHGKPIVNGYSGTSPTATGRVPRGSPASGPIATRRGRRCRPRARPTCSSTAMPTRRRRARRSSAGPGSPARRRSPGSPTATCCWSCHAEERTVTFPGGFSDPPGGHRSASSSASSCWARLAGATTARFGPWLPTAHWVWQLPGRTPPLPLNARHPTARSMLDDTRRMDRLREGAPWIPSTSSNG